MKALGTPITKQGHGVTRAMSDPLSCEMTHLVYYLAPSQFAISNIALRKLGVKSW